MIYKVTGSIMIKKIKGKYKVLSEKGRNMGSYKTKAEAEKRLKQIEFFKHKKSNIQLSLYKIAKRCPDDDMRNKILRIATSAFFDDAANYRLLKISDALAQSQNQNDAEYVSNNLIGGLNEKDEGLVQVALDGLMDKINNEGPDSEMLIKLLNQVEDHARAGNRLALVELGILK